MPKVQNPPCKFKMQKPCAKIPGTFEEVEVVLTKHFHKASIFPCFSLIIEGNKYTIDHHDQVYLQPNLYKGKIFDSSRHIQVTYFPFKYQEILEAFNNLETPTTFINRQSLKPN